MSGSQTQVIAGIATISADLQDHCTIAPTRYLVPLEVYVIVSGAVFETFSDILLLCSDCILFLVELLVS